MKHFAAIAGVLGFSALTAQITITSSDFGSVGDAFNVATQATPPVNPGPSGAGQTWDFSSLVPGTLDTVYFLDPTGLPGATSFPNANLAVESNQGLFYFEKDANGVKIAGGATVMGGFPAVAVYNPTQTMLPFPANFSDSISSSSSFQTSVYFYIDTVVLGCNVRIDSIRVRRHTTLTTKFDGWGTVKLPGGDYTSLRAHSVENTRDSIFIYVPTNVSCPPFINLPQGWNLAPSLLAQAAGLPGNVVDGSNEIYTWYANGEKFGVLALQMDENGNVDNARFKSDTTQLSIVENPVQNIMAFPNPASEYVVFGLNNDSHVIISDLSGRVVWTGEIVAGQPFYTEELNNGVYIFTAEVNGRRTGQGKFVITR